MIRCRNSLWLMALILPAGCSHLPVGADLIAPAVLARYQWQAPDRRWPLPPELAEISGLDHLEGNTFLAHDDNEATLWLLALDTRLETSQWAAGQHLPGDFEALALTPRHVYLLASPGYLYQADITAGRPGPGPWRPQPSGVEGECNFEGLAAAAQAFYLACKYPRAPQPGRVLIYRLRDGRPPEAIHVDVTPVLAARRLSRLRPSALAWLESEQRLLMLAGKERLILELDGTGRLLAWRALPRRFHRQAEALAVGDNGLLVIGDEADGRAATLSVYLPRDAGGR